MAIIGSDVVWLYSAKFLSESTANFVWYCCLEFEIWDNSLINMNIGLPGLVSYPANFFVW